MTKKELQVLERVFAAEIERRLPCQIKSKVAQTLVDKGMLTFGQETLPGRFPVVVEGYYLTYTGRYEYCASCKDCPK